VALEVSDLAAAKSFYTGVIGDHALARGGQRLELVQRKQPNTLTQTGQHQAYLVEATRLPDLAADLGAEWWREDHPAEKARSAYVLDPSGNRVQLVRSDARPDLLFDHVCIELHDLELAEIFYARTLGGIVDYVHGWTMDDYAEAFAWGEGKDACAPWTRRWDVRYWDKLRLPRPNMQTFVRFGDTRLGLILATEHRQEPPPEQHRGTPALLLTTSLPPTEAACHLAAQGVAFEQEGATLYLRDPGGNFIQLASAS
jgi:catechol 2,3-dioxygenase-like lactoylglutathione lyase family enzyme